MILLASLLFLLPALLRVLPILQDALYYARTFLPIALGFLR